MVSSLLRRLGALLLIPALAVAGGESGAPPRLFYGEALFHYFQDRPLETLTRLQLAQERERLGPWREEAQLVEAGLYLNYGMQRQAQTLFEALLDRPGIPATQRGRAWYHLARLALRQGHPEEAEAALGRIEGSLEPPALQEERELLLARALMAQGRNEEAAEALAGWSADSHPHLFPYGLYNRAVALVRAERPEEAIALWRDLAAIEAEDAERLALIDRARIDIGNTLLRLGRPDEALPHFEKVRLDGPFAGAALLGAGWAHVEQERFDRAVLFWDELARRDPTRHATQEAIVGLPYLYSRMGALGAAAEGYRRALETLREEQARLDELIASIEGGALLDTLERLNPARPFESRWQLRSLPLDDPRQRHLIDILARDDFRQQVRNYLDLRQITTTLGQWRQAMGAFDEMLATRRQAYELRAPQVEKRLATLDREALTRRLHRLRQHYEAIDQTDYSLQLASPAERRQWLALADIEQRLDALPQEHPRLERARHTQRLLKGLLIWQMESDYKARLWRVKKGLIEIERALGRLDRQVEGLGQARHEARRGFDGFDRRIATLGQAIDRLATRADGLLLAQGARVNEKAAALLRHQRRALDHYIDRAHFALAQIYDHIATGAESGGDGEARP